MCPDSKTYSILLPPPPPTSSNNFDYYESEDNVDEVAVDLQLVIPIDFKME